MSGDVQPRKRKDKKKKKDDLGVEEPRGTAAAFGEGDVFMHSHSEHGTGGHWCAKVIFFSLLAVLITLIGLIILENRGLTELEANSVESRYSGVLEGWIEDAPDDDHHDEHTLELKHHDEEEHEDEDEEEPANVEIEAIEKEVADDDVSVEEPAQEEEEQTEDVSEELSPNEDESVEDDDVEFLEPDELDELPIVEPITAPKGKPLAEVEESPSTEKPQDTLAEEEEYERQQEELRKEKEQASQGMWLKLTVGGALLVATHAVLHRATATREPDAEDEPEYREETPLSDRRMTLISEPVPPPTVATKLPEVSRPIEREVIREPTVIVQSSPPKEEIEDEEEEEIIISKLIKPVETMKEIVKELYSDEEDIEEEEEIVPIKPQQAVPQAPQTIPDVTKEVTPEPDEDDDVEIIDEEQLEEELEEEEISDVDDAELLSRLEEKYGRLPEGDKRAQKDGGNSIEDEWPGEPADAFWNEHLEQAQRELRQDWLD